MKFIINLNGKEDGSKLTQYMTVFTACIPLFISGIHGGWSGPSIPKILSPEYPFEVSSDEASYIVIVGFLGDIIGGLISSLLIDIIGRKRTILSTTIPQFLSFLCIFLSNYSHSLLYVGRVLGGIGQGIVLPIVPIYISEVAEPKVRGSLGTLTTGLYLSGMLFINILGSYLDLNTTALIITIFPLIFAMLFVSMPESPYYFLMMGRKQEATESLQVLRRKQNVCEELLGLTADIKRQMSEKGGFKDLFTIKSNRKAMIIQFGLRTFQQLTGITGYMMYIQILLKESTNLSPILGSSLVILSQIFMNTTGGFIIDRVGKKPLFIFSSGSCFLFLLSLSVFFILRDAFQYDLDGISWLPLVFLMLLVMCFQIGLGCCSNIVIGELFSASVKSKAALIGSFYFSCSMMAITKFYQYTADTFGLIVPFSSFTIFSFFGFLFYTFVMPETKGKTLEEIQQQFKKKKNGSCLEQ